MDLALLTVITGELLNISGSWVSHPQSILTIKKVRLTHSILEMEIDLKRRERLRKLESGC